MRERVGRGRRPAARRASGSPSVPSRRPSSWTTSGDGGLAPLARLVRAERGRRRVRGQRRDDRPAVAAALARLAGGLDRRRRDGGRDQHVDRAAAREPDVPRLLVADPVADDALPTGLAGGPDLLGRGALDAAAGDGARDPAVVGHEQDGALGPRRASRTSARRPRGPTPAPSAVQPASVSSSSCIACPPACVSGAGGPGPRPGAASRRRAAASAVRARQSPSDGVTRRRMGYGGSPARGSLARAREHLAQPLERGERPGRQEVVDERVGRLHPGRERLVAGRRGQRVEPHEPVAVAPQPGRLGGDERRVAAVPAVATRRSRRRCVRRVRRAHLWLNSRNDSADPRPARPVGDRVGDPGERAVAVAVLHQPGDAGEARPEHERLGAHLVRAGERLRRTAAAAASGAPSSPRCRTGRRAGAARGPGAARPTR